MSSQVSGKEGSDGLHNRISARVINNSVESFVNCIEVLGSLGEMGLSLNQFQMGVILCKLRKRFQKEKEFVIEDPNPPTGNVKFIKEPPKGSVEILMNALKAQNVTDNELERCMAESSENV